MSFDEGSWSRGTISAPEASISLSGESYVSDQVVSNPSKGQEIRSSNEIGNEHIYSGNSPCNFTSEHSIFQGESTITLSSNITTAAIGSPFSSKQLGPTLAGVNTYPGRALKWAPSQSLVRASIRIPNSAIQLGLPKSPFRMPTQMKPLDLLRKVLRQKIRR
ncbi:hypothetical protein G7Y89_g9112 [Cudoniella acicularis]|uniref:Uncharacterized protein n=1 Tax=Cudoniella acicularis TaxID=354080 RepID=A0A8H4W0C9_9HELO|nr:hypothetical protein G7Y89_g9112 [Cudoniella acicularis]